MSLRPPFALPSVGHTHGRRYAAGEHSHYAGVDHTYDLDVLDVANGYYGNDPAYNDGVARDVLSFTVPADLAEGDVFTLEAWGAFFNNTGVNTFFNRNFFLSATDVGRPVATSIATSTSKRLWSARCRWVVSDLKQVFCTEFRMGDASNHVDGGASFINDTIYWNAYETGWTNASVVGATFRLQVEVAAVAVDRWWTTMGGYIERQRL